MTEDAIRVDPTHRSGSGLGSGGARSGAPLARRSGGGLLPVPTELLVLGLTALAVLIAAAVADNFEAGAAWTLVTVLSTAYMLSRGFAKYEHRGHDHTH